MARLSHNLIILLATYAAAVLAAPTSSANNAFNALDTDGSGTVTVAEIKKFALSQGLNEMQTLTEFKELDLNKNGLLELEEIGHSLEQADASTAAAHSKDAAKDSHTQLLAEEPANSTATTAAPTKAAEAAAAPPATEVPETTAAVSTDDASETSSATSESATSAGNETEAEASTKEETGAEMAKVQGGPEAEAQAEQQATRIVAEQFARMAETVLTQRNEDQDQAAQLENYAHSLRNNATKLSEAAPALAQQAAREAAEEELKKFEQEIQDLELKAKAAEAQASELRGQAAIALRNALEAKRNLTIAVEDLSDDAVKNMTNTVRQLDD